MRKPFKILIIQPDTAIIEKSLYKYRDSIVHTQLKHYFTYIEQQEKILKCVGCDSTIKEQIRNRLPKLKAQESEVKKFKYFHLISSYSTEVYNFYFNESKPFSTINQAPTQKNDITNLDKLADSSKSNYIIFFTNVHTVRKNGETTLRLTTSIYSVEDNKVIFSKETQGDMLSRGDMWTCDSPLSCLLINGIRTSTEAAGTVITKRQTLK